MNGVLDAVTNVNNAVNGVVWGVPALALLAFVGVLMTVLTKVFQVSHFGHWMKKTIGAVFKDKHVTSHTKDKSISQFQSLCTALAATVGTGNIVGVSGAILMGGPGAVFWMWVMAFLGMMTNYSENVLGIFYRRKNSQGEWSGGAMYYLRDGLGSKKGCAGIGKVLALLFSLFCLIASFGIGNMTQVNAISGNMQTVFGLPTWVTGAIVMILVGLVVVGGLKRIAAVTEKIVPFMVILYMVGTIVIFFMNISHVGAVFTSIFKSAFGMEAAAGGVVGYGIKLAIEWGMKRGVFSNEAGLGSSVMVHSNSNVREPVKQGMWGIFEVFADTIVVCTLTLQSPYRCRSRWWIRRLSAVSRRTTWSPPCSSRNSASSVPALSPCPSPFSRSQPCWAGAITAPKPVSISSVKSAPSPTGFSSCCWSSAAPSWAITSPGIWRTPSTVS